MHPLNSFEILSAVSGNNSHLADMVVHNVSIDTRTIKPNSIFFAIKGENFDGHCFVKHALSKGANLAIVKQNFYINDLFNDRLIFVKDTITALGELAQYYRNFFSMPFIAITGSVGKTTAKEYIYNILQTRFHCHKTKGNYNNFIGLPLSIFDLEQKHQVSIIEIGTNNFGEVRRLTDIVQPEISIITCISDAHLMNFKNIEGIFKEKIDIYKSKNLKLALYPGDNKLFNEFHTKPHFFSFGFGKDNDYNISIIKENSKFIFSVNNDVFALPTIVKHDVINSVPAIIIGKYFGLTNQEIQQGLNRKLDLSLRMEIRENKRHKWKIIADCYNANPLSMNSALDFFQKQKAESKILILGDMLELGQRSKFFHQQIANKIKEILPSITITIGNDAKYYDGDDHFTKVEEFLKVLHPNYFPENSLILLKGSHSIHLEKVLERLEML